MADKCSMCHAEKVDDPIIAFSEDKCFGVNSALCRNRQIANLTAERDRLVGERMALSSICNTLSAKLTSSETERDRLKALLAKYQWANGGSYCPSCGQYFSNGHLPNCDLAEALK